MKSPDAFRTISEVATDLDVPQHVLRFWETRFSQVRPMKRGGGRRYYRPQDVALLKGIRTLLYAEGFTIKGVQKILRERGVQYVVGASREGPASSGPEAPHDHRPEPEPAIANGARHPSGPAAPVAPMAGASPLGSAAAREIRAALDELASLKRILDQARG